MKKNRTLTIMMLLTLIVSFFIQIKFVTVMAYAKTVTLQQNAVVTLNDTIDFKGKWIEKDDVSTDGMVEFGFFTLSSIYYSSSWRQWSFNGIYITGSESPKPDGFKIKSGTGTEDNPYKFELHYPDPYNISISSIEHGRITSNMNSCIPGDMVTLTISPDNGYEFDDESFSISNVDDYTKDDDCIKFEMPESNVTVNATFKKTSYTIYFDAGDGSGYMDDVKEISDSYELPSCSFNAPEGEEFVGWKIGDSNTIKDAGEYIDVTEDITLTATYESVLYTVTFDKNDGTYNNSSEEVKSGEKASRPSDPEREDYTFLGWFEKENGELKSEAFDFYNTSIRENLTLYAKWEKIIYYTVTFDSNGGSYIDSQSIESGECAINPDRPTNNGLSFLGWFENPTRDNITNNSGGYNTFDFYTAITKDTNLKALWMANFTAEIDGRGQIEIDDSGETPQFSDENPKKYVDKDFIIGLSDSFAIGAKADNGYRFVKWQKRLNSGGYEDYSTDSHISVKVEENLNLVAVFEEQTYSITYDLDGGILKYDNPKSYTIDTETFTLNNPTKDGYIFIGWDGTEISNPMEKVTINRGSIGDRNYTARWEYKGLTDDSSTYTEHPSINLRAEVSNKGKRKKSTVTLSWKKIKDAKCYEIYSAVANEDNYFKKVKTIKKNNIVSYKISNLAWNKEYVYFVRAVKKDGTVLQQSLNVYIVTGRNEKSNAKSVTANDIAIKAGLKAKLSAKVNPINGKKEVFGGRYTKICRYFSSNTSIVEVNEDGEIYAKRVGEAKVFIYAPNGVRKRIKVSVVR